MGLLNIFSRNGQVKLAPTPKGSFTVDRQGRVMTSTLPRSFPESRLMEIGRTVVAVFRGAREAETPLKELLIQFGALRIHAREMRGGAIVFLTPQTLNPESSPKSEK